MRPTLVFVAARPPVPLTNGARIRTHRLLTGLAREYDTVFITFEHHPRSADLFCSRRELEQLLPGIEVITVPGLGPHKRLGQAASLLSRESWLLGRYCTPQMSDAIREAVRRVRPAVVHFDYQGVALCGPIAGPLNVLCSHNLEHELVRQEVESASGIRRLFARVEYQKVRREELAIWRSMSLNLAVAAEEAAAMRAYGASRVDVCPNGTDPVTQLPPPRRERNEALRLLFIGTVDYLPNERGIAWFVGEVLPRLRGRLDCVLDVVGSPPRHATQADEVRYVGNVESVAPWYEQAHAVIVPLFMGGGTSLKVIEAMAFGRPLVATAIGARGLPIEAGRHYLQADDADAFADHLVAIDEACERREAWLPTMLDEARGAISALFWPNVVAQLAELYRTEASRRVVGS